MDLSVPALAGAAPVVDPARFAIGGRAPRHALRPETREEAAEVVRAAGRERLALVPWGGGITLSRASAPERYDVALDLTGLARIVTYEPDDFTITVECGITLEALRTALGAKGQELPLEGAESWGATLGGVLAANASGPRRQRFGGPRDRLLGARFVTGDGVAARTGGRVVKNVAGLGIHRLLCGSHGALAILLEASLKVLPAPPARVAMVHALAGAALGEPARWAAWPRREPAVLTVLGRALAAPHPILASDAAFTVVSGFEDDAVWVDACAEFAREQLGASKLKLADASAATLWQALADAEEMPGPRLTFTSAHRSPAALAPLVGRPVAERLLFHAPHGRLHLWPEAAEAAALVRELAPLGFRLGEARACEAPLQPAPAAVQALRARVRTALDPGGVFAYGERWVAGR